jgi:hypothetical protein
MTCPASASSWYSPTFSMSVSEVKESALNQRKDSVPEVPGLNMAWWRSIELIPAGEGASAVALARAGPGASDGGEAALSDRVDEGTLVALALVIGDGLRRRSL